jgi:predicted metalloprotease
MEWRGRRESSNIEDRRGMGGMVAGGGIVSAVIGLLIYLFSGGDPSSLPQDPGQSQSPGAYQPVAGEDSLKHFVGVVLAETEDVWTELFRREGAQYTDPKLDLFSGRIQSACGMAGSAMGPFYCPLDQKVYIDLSFYRELKDRLGAPGDFAQAYVIAHEVGHHVQNLLGISDKVQQLQQRARGEAQANELSVRLELQADYFAGVWAHYEKERGTLSPGDIEEALNGASAVGDDKLQKQSQGYVVPDAFTHGTSAQRSRWFRKGYETGDMKGGDTFSADNL